MDLPTNRSKMMTPFLQGKITRKVIALILVAALAVPIASFCWHFRPLMKAGHAFRLSNFICDGRVFEIWQRRTDSLSEPFATGLYVRVPSGKWQVYCLNIDDTYAPNTEVNHQQAERRVVFIHEHMRQGHYDLTTDTYSVADEGGVHHVVTPFVSAENPPSTWWLK